MSSRNVFASSVMACLLAIGLGGLAPVANAASAGQSFLNPGASVGTNLIEIKRRGHSQRIYPIVPYIAYDYPYYYSRGYYPTHIGPGYIYNNSYGSERYYDDAADEAVPYSAEERCARRFRSFDWDTGHYTTYGGHTKLCPYLR
jgi:BA14K-like protein